MIGVLITDQPRVQLPGDQHLVQAVAAGAGDPAFRDRVRLRRRIVARIIRKELTRS
jgi:hypothetical protein